MQKIKTILVVGASGATGRLLVEQLLIRGQNVKAIVRSPKSLPEPLRGDPRLSLIHASISELSDSEIAKHVDGCDAVASCLGHNLDFRGLFGRPRRLVVRFNKIFTIKRFRGQPFSSGTQPVKS